MELLERLIRNPYFTEDERKALRRRAEGMTDRERSDYLIRGSEYLKQKMEEQP